MMVEDDGGGIEKENIPKALQLGGTMNRRFSKKMGIKEYFNRD